MRKAKSTTPAEAAAELIAASTDRLRRAETPADTGAASALASAAQAAAIMDVAKQLNVQNLLTLASTGDILGMDVRVRQAALQVAAEALVNVEAALADPGE